MGIIIMLSLIAVFAIIGAVFHVKASRALDMEVEAEFKKYSIRDRELDIKMRTLIEERDRLLKIK